MIVVDSQGRTLYLFEADKPGSSECSGACAAEWPPLTVTGTPTGAGGIGKAYLGTIMRADGKAQVTYYGHPLYYFVRDTGAGTTNGQGVTAFGAKWYVVGANGQKIDTD